MTAGNAAKLRMHHGDKSLEGSFIPISPRQKELCHLRR
jgi:hypothetical protein